MMIWTSNIYFLISFFLLQGIDSGIAPVTTFANPAALCNRDIWPSFGVAEGIPDWRGVKLTFSCLIRAGVCGQMALLEGCRATHQCLVTHFTRVSAHSCFGDKVHGVPVRIGTRLICVPVTTVLFSLTLRWGSSGGWCACDSLSISYVFFPLLFSPSWSVNWTDNHNTSPFRRP